MRSLSSTPHAVETYRFDDAGQIPNNPALPLLVYRGAIASGKSDCAGKFEKLFAAHGWTNSWQDTVYDYDHFHTTAHEVLGIAEGTVTVHFGGETGRDIALRRGDAVAIPAGIGHCRKNASDDLLVVGAYADRRNYDMKKTAKDHPELREKIAGLPIPKSDPVQGSGGPLTHFWSAP